MKNLENEYRNQIDSEAPDLWARIEAGVDAYEESKKETNAPVQEKKENITFFNKYKNTFSKIIVAAACVALVVVAVKGGVLRNFGGSKSAATETAMAETAMETTEAAAENSYYDDSMSEAAAEETYPAYDSNDASPSPDIVLTPEKSEAAGTTEAKGGDKDAKDISSSISFSKDEEEALTDALKDLGYENISNLKAKELSSVDITTAKDLLPTDEAAFMATFVDESQNQKCIVLYSFDTVELTVEIYMIKPANADDTVLYLK